MTAQEILNKFYLAYWMWLEAGAPEENEHTFHRGIGLCGNLTGMKGGTYPVMKLMEQQFNDAGLDALYPFGGYDEYYEEAGEDVNYLNPQRRAWVEKQVSQMNVA